ncbi:MAG: Gfo/Idh/MocA family oxidoreductase [Acidobacteria bacterium]|nr:Gfo/Idh/MocA family oxidoreductase [Acidobacteriota bacterium]
MSTPVRVAVIGVGHLGRHHARILATLPSATLVGVVDIDRQRAEQVAAEHDTQPFGTWQDVQGRVDAVSVAVPTEAHLDVALSLIEQGVHVLVEKPMTRSVDEADRLIAEARARGVVLAVGHTERFNPAVAMARPLLQEPRFIEAHRLGTFPERSLGLYGATDRFRPSRAASSRSSGKSRCCARSRTSSRPSSIAGHRK